jgi:dTDP-4-amino-4,6-dideoxygalactose transaminase
VDEAIAKRKKIAENYREGLNGITGLTYLNDMDQITHTYSYFPVLINEAVFGMSRDAVYEHLKEHNIHTRRYFYPLISNFPTYKGLSSAHPANLPIANEIAEKILCLPIFPDLEQGKVQEMIDIFKALNRKYSTNNIK